MKDCRSADCTAVEDFDVVVNHAAIEDVDVVFDHTAIEDVGRIVNVQQKSWATFWLFFFFIVSNKNGGSEPLRGIDVVADHAGVEEVDVDHAGVEEIDVDHAKTIPNFPWPLQISEDVSTLLKGVPVDFWHVF